MSDKILACVSEEGNILFESFCSHWKFSKFNGHFESLNLGSNFEVSNCIEDFSI